MGHGVCLRCGTLVLSRLHRTRRLRSSLECPGKRSRWGQRIESFALTKLPQPWLRRARVRTEEEALKPSVLIVDDSLTVRMDLAEAFEAGGFTSTLCASVTEARIALSKGSFALLVLDVLLPDGDGIDLLREIRSHSATVRTPIMLLSSEAEVSDRIRGMTTGADEYVGKPYDQSYVVARGLELVREKEPESKL